MKKLNRQTIDRYVTVWHGVRLPERQAEAISAEANAYERLARSVSEHLDFDDEPSDFVHALSGRRGWRGRRR